MGRQKLFIAVTKVWPGVTWGKTFPIYPVLNTLPAGPGSQVGFVNDGGDSTHDRFCWAELPEEKNQNIAASAGTD